MSDGIIRALAYDGQVRVSAVICTETVETARKRHDVFPTAIAVLGRTMASTLLLSWGLKGEGTITLRIFGDGPLGGIIVTGDANGNVKGYVQEPQTDLPLNSRGKLDVGGAIGKGDLYITKDIGLREPYTGSVPLVTGEIGDDVASYLMSSEQTPSVVAVGVLVNPDYSVAAAGGIIIQAMPNADETILKDLEDKLQHVRPVSTLIQEGIAIKDLISHYLPGADIQLLEENPVQWFCNCSKERTSGLLKSIGIQEMEDLLADEDETEVVCHFCNQHYHFNRTELEALLVAMKQDLAKS